ncbi:unnamed protein product [Leptosia nina]|uniref:Peptidase S1 domain-containing protein n=1 Tax=Leptosia nina TaxID=320188 RepID=A0AAV1JIS4_9NEOP
MLAEEHPYIVALLNNTKNYTCTGVIIDHRRVLTSGTCIDTVPTYVVVGSAIAGQRTKGNNIFNVAYTKAHEDYSFEVNQRNQNVTRMHSNIALVFTVELTLLYFTEAAILSNYFESELRNKKLHATGFGEIDKRVTVLQHQRYRQVACTNPKWYYCICGRESGKTYDQYFGEGAPVFYKNEVIGISAFPTGLLKLKNDERYNVFTVISPYLPWIKKTQSNEVRAYRLNSSGVARSSLYFVTVLLVGIKLIVFQYCALLLCPGIAFAVFVT